MEELIVKKNNNVISQTNKIHFQPIQQSEYDKLPEEEKERDDIIYIIS